MVQFVALKFPNALYDLYIVINSIKLALGGGFVSCIYCRSTSLKNAIAPLDTENYAITLRTFWLHEWGRF